MKYAGILKNDFAAAPGISVSFFVQGCPHQCLGCQNPETWDFNAGKEFTPDLFDEIINSLTAQGIERNFCVMGGEPLCSENEFLTLLVIKHVKEHLPETPIYIWTGYTYEELYRRNSNRIAQIFELTDYLIDGPYVESLRDITLPMRGSSNQRIINLKEVDK